MPPSAAAIDAITGAQAVEVDVERQPCPRVPVAARAEHLAHVGGARQPEQTRLVLERVAELGLGQVARSSSHSSKPGSTLPDRVAITSPSSGVKPIVVSTERPPGSRTATRPAPRWQLTIRKPDGETPPATRRPPRDPRVRQPMEAVSPNPPARTPIRRQRVRKRRVRQRGVERRVEARDRRQPRERPRDRVERGQRLRLMQRRQVDQLAQRRRTPASTSTASRNRAPPCTIRCPTASASPRPSASAARNARVDRRPRRGKLRRSERLVVRVR